MEGVSGPGVGSEATVTQVGWVGTTALGVAVLTGAVADSGLPHEASRQDRRVVRTPAKCFVCCMLGY